MTLRAVAILMVSGMVLLSGSSPAPAQARTEMLSTEVTALDTEVAAITERLAQVGRQRQELSRHEDLLSAQVEKLKGKTSGVVRDTQLKTALKDLRAILANVRNLAHLERILRTTLQTRQVALIKATEREAKALIRAGKKSIRAGDYKIGRDRFAMAMDYLLIKGTVRPPQAHLQYPKDRLAIQDDIVLTGDETPDELLEIAQIMQDTSEKIRITGQSLTRELTNLRQEQATLEALLAIQSAGTAAGAEALRRLIARAGRVEGRVIYLQRQFTRHLARAAALEAQSRREESALLAP